MRLMTEIILGLTKRATFWGEYDQYDHVILVINSINHNIYIYDDYVSNGWFLCVPCDLSDPKCLPRKIFKEIIKKIKSGEWNGKILLRGGLDPIK